MASMLDLECDGDGLMVGRYRLQHAGGVNGSVGQLQFKHGECVVEGREKTAAVRGAIAAMGPELTITRIDAPAAETIEPADAPESEEVDWAEPEASEPDTKPAIETHARSRTRKHK